MEGVLFDCPGVWRRWLPPEILAAERGEELLRRRWDLLALTRRGCRDLGPGRRAACRVLLVPGDCPPALLADLRAERVISWGLSPRDSLTLSSLTQPVLCVQRRLPRPDGGWVEPQELPLPPLPAPAEELLPLLGLRLLRMPLTEDAFSW